MIRTTPALLSSVWGEHVCSAACCFNPDTGVISDIQNPENPYPAAPPQRQYVTVNGHDYAVEINEDGNLAAVLTYGVFVTRNGYCQVKASSSMKARQIVDDTFSDAHISWDDSWNVTDTQVEECGLEML